MVNGSPPRIADGYMSDWLGYSTALTDLLETVPALVWPESVRTYGQMRNDPRIAAVLSAYSLPLLNATTAVDPAGCRDEVVQQTADDLGVPILGVDPAPGPARRRGVDWDDHLRLALLNLVFGHMGFAQQYEIRDSRARLTHLAERMPSTITEIQVEDSGALKGIMQFGESSAIPARHLVWYTHRREGSNWAGRSMLREAYGAWLIKHEMWRVLATSSARFGAGTPVVEAPPGGTPGQVEQATQLAQAIRVGTQGGAGIPSGFKVTLAGITGSTPDTLAFVRYLDQQIAEMALATVLNLDASPNGSRALGDVMLQLLQMSWASVAKEITTPATRLSVQMVDYNWGEDEPAPRIVMTGLNRVEPIVEAITGLMREGAITPDAGLESSLRERLSLPARIQELAGAAGHVPPDRLADLVQSIYLGVGTVITDTEARQILIDAGANIPLDPVKPLDGRPALRPAETPEPAPDVVGPADARDLAAQTS